MCVKYPEPVMLITIRFYVIAIDHFLYYLKCITEYPGKRIFNN